MVRWIILASLVVILTVAGTFVVSYVPDASPEPAIALHKTPEGPPPKLELVGPPQFDFGTMPKRTDGAHSWEIKNVGEGPLEIWLEDTSCSCTVAKLADDKKTGAAAKKSVTVPPGESTPIEVSWNTKEWIAFGQTATLGTNDPKQRSVTLRVRGKVLMPVAIEPSETVAFPSVSYEESSRSNLKILSPDQAGLKLTKVTSSKPGLVVTDVKPMTPEEIKELGVLSGYHLIVEVKPGLPLGPFREEVVIQTDHPKQPEVKLAVSGRVMGPISVTPEKLGMPNVGSREGASRDVSLVVRGGKETHIEVAYAPEKLKVAVVPDKASRVPGRYRMTVTVPPGTPGGLVDDRIVLKTDHPQAGEIKIPVSIYVTRSGPG